MKGREGFKGRRTFTCSTLLCIVGENESGAVSKREGQKKGVARTHDTSDGHFRGAIGASLFPRPSSTQMESDSALRINSGDYPKWGSPTLFGSSLEMDSVTTQRPGPLTGGFGA